MSHLSKRPISKRPISKRPKLLFSDSNASELPQVRSVKNGIFEAYNIRKRGQISEADQRFKIHYMPVHFPEANARIKDAMREGIVLQYKITTPLAEKSMDSFVKWYRNACKKYKSLSVEELSSLGCDSEALESEMKTIKKYFSPLGYQEYGENLLARARECLLSDDELREICFFIKSAFNEILQEGSASLDPSVKQQILQSVTIGKDDGCDILLRDFERYLKRAGGTIYIAEDQWENPKAYDFLHDLEVILSKNTENHASLDVPADSKCERSIPGYNFLSFRLAKDDRGDYIFHEDKDNLKITESGKKMDEFLSKFKKIDNINISKRSRDGENPFLNANKRSKKGGVKGESKEYS
jgi:hypothetical protein